MGGRQKVKSFEQIRLGYAAGETINGLAKKHVCIAGTRSRFAS
jgi:hypothetical protein